MKKKKVITLERFSNDNNNRWDIPISDPQDILENEQMKLDRVFRGSLVHDIVRGIGYLHASEIRSHGNLKSSNCLVDSRFVLKIADFGLYELRKPHPLDPDEDRNSYAYWRSKFAYLPFFLTCFIRN